MNNYNESEDDDLEYFVLDDISLTTLAVMLQKLIFARDQANVLHGIDEDLTPDELEEKAKFEENFNVERLTQYELDELIALKDVKYHIKSNATKQDEDGTLYISDKELHEAHFDCFEQIISKDFSSLADEGLAEMYFENNQIKYRLKKK